MSKIEWTAGNGAKISVAVFEYLDQAVVDARIAGRRESGILAPLAKPVSKGGDTFVAAIGRVALTQERLDAVLAAQAALQAEIDARPKVAQRKLARQRLAITDALAGAEDASHDAHVRAIEQASAYGFSALSPRDFDAEIVTAREALAAFDAAHPEVVAALAAEKEEAVTRFLVAD